MGMQACSFVPHVALYLVWGCGGPDLVVAPARDPLGHGFGLELGRADVIKGENWGLVAR